MKFLKLFLILVLILIFLVGCQTSSEIPDSSDEQTSGEQTTDETLELSSNEEIVYTGGDSLNGELVSSPDGKRWALLTEDHKVIVDSNLVGKYSSVGEFKFSPDSKKYAFFMTDNEIGKIVYDGKPLDYETTWLLDFIFADDGRLVYITQKYSPESGTREAVVIDGIKQKEYGRISDFIVGKKVVYTTSDESYNKIVAIEDKEYKYNGEKIEGLVVTPDGNVAWAVYNREVNGHYPGQFVVVDGKEEKYYDDITNVQITPDGKIAYIAKVEPEDSSQDIKWFAVIDGKEEELNFPAEVSGFTKDADANVKRLFFDSDGKLHGYSLNDGDDDRVLVIDDKVIKGSQYAVNNPIYGFNEVYVSGQKFYVVLQERREDFGFEDYYLISNDGLIGKYSLIPKLEVKDNMFVYVAHPEQKGELGTPLSGEVLDQMIFINGKQENYPNIEELSITPQNKVVYEIGPSVARYLDTLVIDNQKGREYGRLSNYVILPDGKVVHYAILGDKVLRVTRD